MSTTFFLSALLLVWSSWLLIFFQHTSFNYLLRQASRAAAVPAAVTTTIERPINIDSNAKRALKTNSSLVIIMGNLRGGEQAWHSLYRNVLDANSADLALIIGQRKRQNYGNPYPNSTLYTRAKYVWTFHEYDDWADAIDLVFNGTTTWRQTHLPYFTKKRAGLLGGVANHEGSGAIIFMIRWFLAQRLITNPNILNQYERFVLTRADHYYQCQHSYQYLDLSNDTMWIPGQGENYGGFTDRHLIVSRNNILDALDIFPTLFQQQVINNGTFQEWIAPGNPESILKRVWMSKKLNVKRTERVMFTCATELDSSRWKRAKGDVPGIPGLLKKYESEYNETQLNCPPVSRLI